MLGRFSAQKLKRTSEVPDTSLAVNRLEGDIAPAPPLTDRELKFSAGEMDGSKALQSNSEEVNFEGGLDQVTDVSEAKAVDVQVSALQELVDRAEGKTKESMSAGARKLLDAKVRLHHKLLEDMNLSAMDSLPVDEIRPQIHDIVSSYVIEERLALTARDLARFVDEIIDEMLGLGPLEPLLKDPSISDILINGHECVFIERGGQLEPAPMHFRDEAHLLRIVNRIVSAVGRRVDESQPLCDARLLDGSRVNVAVRPIAVDGPLVSIRKFSKKPMGLDKLVEVGALRPAMAEVLAAAVAARITTIVSGGTGSGKTTMLNALSSFISDKERLITIEDAAELQLQQSHVARMETRPPNMEGRGEIKQRDLVKNALRMRPERIILGECRGEEAFDMLQAMNTGHEGSMATIHANSPREAISRLEQMIGMAGLPMSQMSIRSQISAAICLVVQLQRLSDGSRRVTSIAEITGMEGDIVQMQEIFRFVRTSTEPNGKIIGHYEATGMRPRFLQELVAHGVKLSGDYFDPSKTL